MYKCNLTDIISKQILTFMAGLRDHNLYSFDSVSNIGNLYPSAFGMVDRHAIIDVFCVHTNITVWEKKLAI